MSYDTGSRESGMNAPQLWETLNRSEFWPHSIIDWVHEYNQELLVIFNIKGEVVYHTKSVERKLGYSAEEIKGSYWYDKMADEDIVYVHDNFFCPGETTKAFNVRLLDNTGEWLWFEVHMARHIYLKKFYYIALLNDISYQKENEQLMVTSEQMSVAGQLAASVAHEIRNPLTSLKGFVQLLQAGVSEKDAYFKIMLEEIEKMETITTELLFISKPLSDDFYIEPVNDMISAVIKLLKPQSKMKHIELKWTAKEHDKINCNRSQVKQVLINLIKNALEAMNPKGSIYIDTCQNKDWLYIDVIDEGPGVSDEILPKLNDPFFTTKKDGTGLGLAISQQILTKHGGELIILQNEQQGSTFRVKLPVTTN